MKEQDRREEREEMEATEVAEIGKVSDETQGFSGSALEWNFQFP